VSYRRVEMVGPKVSADLLWAGSEAVVFAVLAILAYIWFRFEWQYGVGAVVALIHDALTTLGLFSLFGLEFNLSSVAALLTIVGYSINDTVVIYDRIRENLRRYKAMPLDDLIDRSLNETLARTTMTSLTTLLALVALAVVGGPVVRGFTIAMIWGVFIGTYSSVYVAAPMVLHLHLRREPADAPAGAPDMG
jgi:preprotein translocase SecF subunit